MRTQVRKIGNSLGSIIPATLLKELKLEKGSDIEVKLKEGVITIKPITKDKKLPFSEADLLADLTPELAHADTLASLADDELGYE